ncbi:sensor histidine kinase [Salinispira pacifica]
MKKSKILCIDDDPLIRDVFKEHLEKSGFSVRTASNGTEGIELFRNEVPDLVLCDLRMPGIDGLEVVSALHRIDTGIPIIVVSGTALIHDAVEALKGGAWDFVTKPVRDLEVLNHIINSSLERAKLIRENQRYKNHLEAEVEQRTRALKNEIAERRRTESELKRSLEEKEALLKEVHHRVKNNLQVISSLLRLQQQYVSDPASLRAFADSQNRVRSMALVHDLLYRSAEISRISAAEYLEGLVNSLVGSDSGPTEIDCSVWADTVDLKVEVAIPSGLIVNELVTNAMRHAFPPAAGKRAEGKKIEVTLTSEVREEGQLFARLCIRDTGRGLPAQVDPKNPKTLGLQLVQSLVMQLDGTLELAPAETGTAFEILFPLP